MLRYLLAGAVLAFATTPALSAGVVQTTSVYAGTLDDAGYGTGFRNGSSGSATTSLIDGGSAVARASVGPERFVDNPLEPECCDSDFENVSSLAVLSYTFAIVGTGGHTSVPLTIASSLAVHGDDIWANDAQSGVSISLTSNSLQSSYSRGLQAYSSYGDPEVTSTYYTIDGQSGEYRYNDQYNSSGCDAFFAICNYTYADATHLIANTLYTLTIYAQADAYNGSNYLNALCYPGEVCSGAFQALASADPSVTIDPAYAAQYQVYGGLLGPPIPASIGNAPEPATWVMLVAGFGLVGAAVRRRRVVA